MLYFLLLNVDSFSRLNVTSCRKYDIFQFHSSGNHLDKMINKHFGI